MVSHDTLAAAHPPKAYLPDNLDLSIITPNRRDAAAYFVGRLYLGRHVAGKDPDEFQQLYSPLLQDLLGYDYRRGVINPLLKHEVVEECKSYRVGDDRRKGYSKGFRLAHQYRDARFGVRPITNPEMVRRLGRRREAEDCRLDAPVHRHLKSWLGRLTVTADYPADVLPLRALADGHRWFTSCRQGRLHTNLSNLKRDYRRHIRLDGVRDQLQAIDIKTSQPLLLGLTLLNRAKVEQDENYRAYDRQIEEKWEREKRKKGKGGRAENTIPYVGDYSARCLSDLERYITLCRTQDIYRVFVDRTGLTRSVVKTEFLRAVYSYPEVAEKSPLGPAFRAEFPALWAVLKEINAADNARLPRFLQTVESWLVIWRTCGRLAEEYPDAPLLTIHDCLVTTPRYVEPFRRALEGEFRKVWGVEPQTDTKALAV